MYQVAITRKNLSLKLCIVSVRVAIHSQKRETQSTAKALGVSLKVLSNGTTLFTSYIKVFGVRLYFKSTGHISLIVPYSTVTDFARFLG